MQVKHLFIALWISFSKYHIYNYLLVRKYFGVVCWAFLLFFATGNITVSAQTFDWIKGMGGTPGSSADWGMGTTVDNMGNVYITGFFNGNSTRSINFNPGGNGGTMAAVGRQDAFIAKYDIEGNFVWANLIGEFPGGMFTGTGVAVNDSGHVYVSGVIGGGSFLSKCDTDGTLMWTKLVLVGSTGGSYGVAVDHKNNVYLSGCFNGTRDLNPGGNGGTISTSGTGEEVFLAKYDAGGNFLWVRNAGKGGQESGYGIDVDKDNNVYLNGGFAAAKYDESGNLLWIKNEWFSRDVAVDGSGNVYATGEYRGSVDFNPGGNGGTITATGFWNAFLVKYDTDGKFLWVKSMGQVEVFGRSVAVDRADNVYVTGYFAAATVDFNPVGTGTTHTNSGIASVFIAKYDPNGNYLWSKGSTGMGWNDGYGIAVDNKGNVFGTGHFSGTGFNFNSGGNSTPLTPVSFTDIFIVKFICSDTSSSFQTVSIPCGASYTLGDTSYTEEGLYSQVVPNTAGCDSTVTLDLSILPMDKPDINVDSFTLGVNGDYTTYQWFKNGELIPGATESTYTVTENADYQVTVTNEYGCESSSDVYPVTNYTEETSITHIPIPGNQVRIYPNPAVDGVYIHSPVKANIQITDMAGKLIKNQINAIYVPIHELNRGIYLLNITDEKGIIIKVEKLIKAE